MLNKHFLNKLFFCDYDFRVMNIHSLWFTWEFTHARFLLSWLIQTILEIHTESYWLNCFFFLDFRIFGRSWMLGQTLSMKNLKLHSTTQLTSSFASRPHSHQWIASRPCPCTYTSPLVPGINMDVKIDSNHVSHMTLALDISIFLSDLDRCQNMCWNQICKV